jgi:hypothetical protein
MSLRYKLHILMFSVSIQIAAIGNYTGESVETDVYCVAVNLPQNYHDISEQAF